MMATWGITRHVNTAYAVVVAQADQAAHLEQPEAPVCERGVVSHVDRPAMRHRTSTPGSHLSPSHPPGCFHLCVGRSDAHWFRDKTCRAMLTDKQSRTSRLRLLAEHLACRLYTQPHTDHTHVRATSAMIPRTFRTKSAVQHKQRGSVPHVAHCPVRCIPPVNPAKTPTQEQCQHETARVEVSEVWMGERRGCHLGRGLRASSFQD